MNSNDAFYLSQKKTKNLPSSFSAFLLPFICEQLLYLGLLSFSTGRTVMWCWALPVSDS